MQLIERGMGMEERTKYFVLKQKAVPEVLLKVVEAKRLLESEKAMTVQEASDRVGISRSSFTSTRTIFFPFTIMRRDEQSPWFFRWTMKEDCSLTSSIS